VSASICCTTRRITASGWCPTTPSSAVEREELVKGYEYEKDQYIIIEPADLDKIKIESSDTLTIERFVDEREVDPIYLDSPYYLAPDGAVAEEAFRVIHEAMQREKKVAISRIVLASRERPVALSVRDKGFLVTTLRPPSEVRGHEAYFEDIRAGEIANELLALARQLIAKRWGRSIKPCSRIGMRRRCSSSSRPR
jgi:DNA end-binding protein Ku